MLNPHLNPYQLLIKRFCGNQTLCFVRKHPPLHYCNEHHLCTYIHAYKKRWRSAFYICTKIASAIQRGLGLFGVHSKKEKLYVVNSFQAFLEWILKNEAWPRISFYGSYCFNGHKRKAFLKPQRPKAYQFISNCLSGKTLNKEYAILNLSQHTQ